MELSLLVTARLNRFLLFGLAALPVLALLHALGLPARIEAALRRNRDLVRAITFSLMTAIVVYAGVFAVFRHYALLTNTLDMGNIEQAVWNTAHGQPFRMTTDAEYETDAGYRDTDTPAAPIRDLPDSRLAFHVEPILLPISLIYAIVPRTETLALLQVLAFAVSAWLIGKIAGKLLDSPLAQLAFTLAFLLAQPIWHAIAFDVHFTFFGLPLFLAAVWFALQKRFRWSLVVGILLALTREELIPTALLFGLWLSTKRESRRHGLILASFSLVWLIAAFAILRSFNPDGYQYLGRYANLREALGHPAALLNFLLHPARILYAVWLLLPLALLPIRGWRIALMAAVPFGAIFLSSSLPLLLGIYHYHAFTFGVLTVAAITGAVSLTPWLQRRGLSPALMPLAVILLTILVQFSGANYTGLPQPQWQTVRAIREAAARIPASASVSAMWSLGPWVARRSELSLLTSPKLATANYIFVRDCQTPVCDNVTKKEYDALLEPVLGDPRVRLIFSRDRILLYERQ